MSKVALRGQTGEAAARIGGVDERGRFTSTLRLREMPVRAGVGYVTVRLGT
jgi:hypothetical protein